MLGPGPAQPTLDVWVDSHLDMPSDCGPEEGKVTSVSCVRKPVNAG